MPRSVNPGCQEALPPGSLMGGYIPVAVWGTLIMGAVCGLIIDVIATKIAGDGQATFAEWSR